MSTNEARTVFVDRLDRHRGVLVKVAGAYCRDAAGREDLIAEIVAALWRAYPRFGERAAFSTWMYRIAGRSLTAALHGLAAIRRFTEEG
jgi:RNA polymerase sigma-70 factor, ECF subfamily